MLKILAIIPARGGSKGVPNKNMHDLGTMPLIGHTIQQAKDAHLVDKVIVSTDDHKIENYAVRQNVVVVERPRDISGDKASSEDALLHVLKVIDYEPDIIVFLQCTSPLRTARDIDRAINQLIVERADSLVAVSPFSLFLWKDKQSKTGSPFGINHDPYERKMRQDIEENDKQWIEAGALYVMRTKGFLEAKHRFFGKISLFEMPEERCLDINTEADFKIAEALL